MLLEVKDLRVSFRSRRSLVEAARGISFSVDRGQALAIVGESGSGKSVSCLALTGLLPREPQCRVEGRALLDGEDLLGLDEGRLRRVRGGRIAYVFQEPSTALNPFYTVGSQICEALAAHRREVSDRRGEAVRLMELVGIRDAAKRVDDFPHQMSGGMKQRVVIAMALACRPDVLIADEPTTALDVTVEAQIIRLLSELRVKLGMAVILITHNFGIVDGFADAVAVMFRGSIVEYGEAAQVLGKPKHPYTQALIRCIPRLGERRERLPVVDYAGLGLGEGGRDA